MDGHRRDALVDAESRPATAPQTAANTLEVAVLVPYLCELFASTDVGNTDYCLLDDLPGSSRSIDVHIPWWSLSQYLCSPSSAVAPLRALVKDTTAIASLRVLNP